MSNTVAYMLLGDTPSPKTDGKSNTYIGARFDERGWKFTWSDDPFAYHPDCNEVSFFYDPEEVRLVMKAFRAEPDLKKLTIRVFPLILAEPLGENAVKSLIKGVVLAELDEFESDLITKS